MARLGHGMCHIEFLELFMRKYRNKLFKNELLVMYIQSILAKYIKMGTIKYMA